MGLKTITATNNSISVLFLLCSGTFRIVLEGKKQSSHYQYIRSQKQIYQPHQVQESRWTRLPPGGVEKIHRLKKINVEVNQSRQKMHIKKWCFDGRYKKDEGYGPFATQGDESLQISREYLLRSHLQWLPWQEGQPRFQPQPSRKDLHHLMILNNHYHIDLLNIWFKIKVHSTAWEDYSQVSHLNFCCRRRTTSTSEDELHTKSAWSLAGHQSTLKHISSLSTHYICHFPLNLFRIRN